MMLDTTERSMVEQLGELIGYGRVMQLCEEIWSKKSEYQCTPGAEFTVGPCAAFMVECKHLVKDRNGHCDVCCGAGRVTKFIAELVPRAKKTYGL